MTPEHFLLIADALPDPLVLLSGDGRVLAGNPATRELLGLQPDVLRGRTLAEIAADPPDEVAHYLRLCSRSRSPVLGAMVLRGPGGDIACRTFGSLVSPKTEGADAFVLLRLLPKQAAAGQFIALNRQIEELKTEVQRRKRAEEEARQQEERLRVTLLSIGDAVIASDTAGRVTSMNAVAESLTGWTTADAAGQSLETVFRIVNEATRQPVENPALRALKEGVIVGLANHTVLIARDGTERPVEDSAAPIRSASGEVVGCVLVFRDVGERRRLEGERREAQERVAATLESVTDGFVRYDRDWRIVYANAEAERINQLTRSEMLGKTPWELFPALVGTRLETEFRRAVADRVTVEFENHYEPFGRWYALKGYPTADGGLTTFIRDITDRKRAENVLRRSEARFRRVFESNVVGMIRWDLDRSLILDANDEFLRMTGYTRDDVAAGRLNFRDMTPPEWTARNEEGIRTIRADGQAVPYEKEYFRKDGSRVPLIIAGTRFDDSPSEGMSLLIDISDRKRAEREVVRLATESERQRRLYETVLTNTPDFVYVFSLDHRVLYANDALLRMWGRGRDGAVGKTFLEIGYEPWHAEMHDREIDRVRATKQPIRGEVPFAGADGRRDYEYIFVPVLGADGGVEGVAGTTRDVTERKEAERAIRAGEERLRAALSAARMVAWEWTPADGRLRVSENAADVFGLPAGVGLTGIDQGLALLHPDDAAAYRATFQQAIDDRTGYLTRYRLVRPDDGRVVWIEERGQTVFDQPGGGVRLYGVAMDVTDRERAEAALRASEERFRAIVTQAAVGVAQTDFAGRFTLVNPQYCGLVGYAEAELLGMRMQDLTHPDDLPANLELFHALAAGGPDFVVEKRYVRRDGSHVWVSNSVTAVRDAGGRLEGVLAVAVDLTDRRRAEAAVRESERRFREMADTAPVALWTTDPDGSCTFLSREWYEFTGQTEAEALGLGWTTATHPDDQADAGRVFLAANAARTTFRTEYRLRTRDGAYRWAMDIGRPRYSPAGEYLGMVGAVFDLENRRQAEQALRDADRRKDEFLATLAHELRNPLAPIRNGLQVIRMAGANGTIEQARAMMERQLGQMVRLVDDLLDVSRVTTGKLELRRERTELRAVVDAALETTRPVIEQAGHELTVAMPDEPIFLDGDPLRLAQVVANLLTNSAKYTHRGGHIRLSVGRDGDSAVVAVKDDGIGIPPSMLGRVFEMFVQVDRTLEKTTGGLGIGLSLVKGLVEMHGGTIEARSEGEGRGSEFVVRLPVVTAGSGGADRNGPAEEVVPSSLRRILVVDDNEDAADSLGQLLEMLGNEVRTAYDGEAGIRAAAEFRPAVVLCDIGMPKVNGYAAARRIRAEPWGQNMVLVALTGWGQEDDRQKSADAGFDHHLVKPVETAALMKLLAGLPVATA